MVHGPSGRLQSVHLALILNVKPIDEAGKFSKCEKIENFENLGHEASLEFEAVSSVFICR